MDGGCGGEYGRMGGANRITDGNLTVNEKVVRKICLHYLKTISPICH